VDLANSLLTTVTWTAYYATTADTFGTLASPTRTQIATGTFTVTSTVTRYSTNISISAAATTGIEIVFTVGAQTSGTWTIGNVQLEPGTVATPFERRSFGQELALCQRYFESSFSDGTVPGTDSLPVVNTGAFIIYADGGGTISFAVRKRTIPTMGIYSPLTTTCANKVRQSSSGTILTINSLVISQSGYSLLINSGANSTQYQLGWTASAEL